MERLRGAFMERLQNINDEYADISNRIARLQRSVRVRLRLLLCLMPSVQFFCANLNQLLYISAFLILLA